MMSDEYFKLLIINGSLKNNTASRASIGDFVQIRRKGK
jgi:hypothetical protein